MRFKIFAVSCLLFSFAAHADAPRTFSEAKKVADRKSVV